jgi:hypothetical protein
MEEIKAKEEEKKGCCQDSKAKPKKIERTVLSLPMNKKRHPVHFFQKLE